MIQKHVSSRTQRREIYPSDIIWVAITSKYVGEEIPDTSAAPFVNGNSITASNGSLSEVERLGACNILSTFSPPDGWGEPSDDGRAGKETRVFRQTQIRWSFRGFFRSKHCFNLLL